MVVKIQQSASVMSTVLAYNEKKVAAGEAERVMLSEGMPDNREGIARVFRRYEAANIRTDNVSFHMSINPGEGDSMSDEDIRRFARRIFDSLGYGDQPFVLYRHHDIDRTHYHLVSIRVNSEGRQIKDSFERRKLQKIMERLRNEFGNRYVIGKDGERQQGKAAESIPALPEGISLMRFDPEGSNVRRQLSGIASACLAYRFTTFSQLQAIAAFMGVSLDYVQTGSGADGGRGFAVTAQGLDRQGRPCTAPLTEESFRPGLYAEVTDRIAQCEAARKETLKNRQHLAALTQFAAEHTHSAAHFRNMLAKKGVQVEFARREDGKIYGATFIDHTTRCAFKASDLGKDISGALFARLEEDGTWRRPLAAGEVPQDGRDGHMREGPCRKDDAARMEERQREEQALAQNIEDIIGDLLESLGRGSASRGKEVHMPKKRKKME